MKKKEILNGGIDVKKTTKFLKLNLMFILIGMFIMATGCSKKDKTYSETLVLSVDDSKVYMDEMMYHVMLAKMQGDLYASVVGTDGNYWDIKNDEGITMGEATKEMALNNAIKYQLLYNIAIQEGYTLSDEDKEMSQSKVDNILSNIAEQLKTNELTKEKLIKIQEKIAIATNYYNDFISNLGVDEEAIKSQFNVEDYKQYDIQYIFAQKQQYDELASLLEAASITEDITTLTTDTNVTSGKLSFLEGKDTFAEETILEDTIKAMKVGETSKIVETVKGYYIIKLTDNTSTKKFDSAVKEAVDTAIAKEFDAAYDTLKKEHKITIKHKVWDQLKMENVISQ